MAGGQFKGTDINVSGDWENGTPTAGDPAILPPGNINNIIDGGTTLQGIDLGYLQTHAAFRGSLGVTGTPIIAWADLMHFQGAGGCFIELDGNSASAVTDEIIFDAMGGNTKGRFELGSYASDPGNADKVYAVRGDVLIKSNIVWESTAVLEIGFRTARRSDVNLTVSGSGPTLPKLIVNGGTSHCHSVVTDLTIADGVHYQEDAKAVSINVLGGRLVYNHAASGTDVTLCVVHAGATLDLNGNSESKTFVRTIALPGSQIAKNDNRHTLNLLDLGATMI